MKIFVWKGTAASVCSMVLCGILALGMIGYAAAYPSFAEAFAADRPLPIYCVEKEQKVCSISFDAAWGDGCVRQPPARVWPPHLHTGGRCCPSVFAFVETGNEKRGIVVPHHTVRSDVDPDALEIRAAMYVQFTPCYIEKGPATTST